MRLAEFIVEDMDAILAEWEAFAATLAPAAEGMASLGLRNHAEEILRAVAKDLATAQTRQAQSEKSKGLAQKVAGAPETAAQTHAVLRARAGFDINQLVAEYRALRASVLRRWIDATSLDHAQLADMVRFNEAIDQAVAESVGHFHSEVERARNLLLGMLGHDMRSPLNTIVTTASYLAQLNAGEKVSVAATRLIRSGVSMQALLDDLVDFNRAKLGLGIRIVPTDVDLAKVVHDEVEQLRGAHPKETIELAMAGDLRGQWDGKRLQQLLRNLVLNAIRYGSPNQRVRVVVHGDDAQVNIDVENTGPTIDPSTLSRLFEPLKRGPVHGESDDDQAGLGLGLFIVREIAEAHRGKVDVGSEAGHTVFAVRLPR